jgi:hypothetical protein
VLRAPTFDVHGNYLMSSNVSETLHRPGEGRQAGSARAEGHQRAWPTAIVFTPIGGHRRDRCDSSQNMKMEIQGEIYVAQI